MKYLRIVPGVKGLHRIRNKNKRVINRNYNRVHRKKTVGEDI